MADESVKVETEKETGVIYMTTWGAIYGDSTVDATKIGKFMNNVYGRQVAKRQEYIIFTERFELAVYDAEGEPDNELADHLTNMVEKKGVNLWNKMQMAWRDMFWWGMSFFNPVWIKDGNEVVLQKLRRLPPETFTSPAPGASQVYSKVLQGVQMDEDGNVEYWQVQEEDGQPVELEAKYVFSVKDPTDNALAGTPMVLPIIPVLSMLDFAWNAQMQRVNRVGAPLLFLRITAPTGDDVDYGKKLLKNWGKNTSYQLRENFELLDPGITDTSSAMETIEALSQLLIEHFSPVSSISKQGTLIGGSDWGQVELLRSYIDGVHRMLEESFEMLLAQYLELNGYVGHTVEIYIPSPSIDRSEIMVEQAKTAFLTGAATVNEIRKLLELEELDEEGLALLAEQVGSRPTAAVQGEQFMLSEGKPPTWAEYGFLNARPIKTAAKLEKALTKEFDSLADDIFKALAQKEKR